MILTNLGSYAFDVKICDRIAQAVFSRFEHVSVLEYEEISDSERGASGFGGTGL